MSTTLPALEAHPTVRVPLALRLASRDGVGVWRVAIETAADGVARLHAAGGAGAAGGGAAGVRGGRGEHPGVGVLLWRAAAVDGARVGDEPGPALADGVSLGGVSRPLIPTWPFTMQLVFSPQGDGLHALPGFCWFLL